VSLIELREGGEGRAQGEKEEGSQVVAVLLLVEIVKHKQGDDLVTPVGVLPKRVSAGRSSRRTMATTRKTSAYHVMLTLPFPSFTAQTTLPSASTGLLCESSFSP
jgi:hypothetical protein